MNAKKLFEMDNNKPEILEKMKEMVGKAFKLEKVETEELKGGLFSKKEILFIIPKSNMKMLVEEFEFVKNIYKSGLIQADKKRDLYFISSEALEARSDHKKKKGKRQFFSLDGNDEFARNTLNDALFTIDNVRKITNKLGIKPADVTFSIRHKNGDVEDVVNVINFDSSLFGATEEEIEKNVNKLNNVVKFDRKMNYDM